MPPTVLDLLAQIAPERRLIPEPTLERPRFLRWLRDRPSVEREADSDNGAVPMDIDPPFDPGVMGLKEIGNLASWTVSSCKPGCGVEALRDEDTKLFWQ